ncbi:amylo-alpha-1,6-glucosidase [Neobacillus ginsengisoli]|uniref:Glycogen debranching enzyme n=1 Tax=Neobacillus ginsengisoli TaxID=904295 RepID=A0ABT9XT81_9BACI|nr:trehalase family glycosidase [Neobacillus ginsengisoli]MDQ0198701.1 glycogen debranching enzyme [Neobacillus ginsengisoli]
MMDILKVPFSRFGSFIVISPLHGKDNDNLYIRNIRNGDNDLGETFRLDVLSDGQIVPYKPVLKPTILRLEAAEGFADISITEAKVLQIRSEGVGIRLTGITGAYDYAIPANGECWEVNHSGQEIHYMLTPIKGKLVMDAPFQEQRCLKIVADFIPDPQTLEMDCAIEEYFTDYKKRSYLEFLKAQELVQNEFQTWLDHSLECGSYLKNGRELAAYITWSCVVEPEGKLTRPAMYMSKNWMTNIWSWDHCFNALALAENSPELAWEQFVTFFDHQAESGMLPDFINNRYALWNFTKPPIHGWTLKQLMENREFVTKEKLQEVYEPLIKWTDWWLQYRDDDHDGIPQYNHGNDSGWDNSTIFHRGTPIESPDLSAFLILQMEVLAEIAREVGKKEDAEKWARNSKDLLARMIVHFWKNDRFTAVRSGDHSVIHSESLVLFVPIILGNRLPEPIRKSLVEGLVENGFITEFGLATEKPTSSFFQEDGYWRGPIWAPTTLLIYKGLVESGETELAKVIAKKFCDMANKSGMAENFQALTGEGLRDPAFTWTSSVFLILANALLE